MSFAGVSLISDGKAIGHAIDVSTASGYHLLVVNGYSHIKATTPNGKGIFSLPFMVGGHRWRIKYYPNGDCLMRANSVSIYVFLDENVTEALKVWFEVSFVDELEMQDPTYIRRREPINFSSSTLVWGQMDFMETDTLENCFTIRCDLAIATTTDLLIKVPPSSLQQHISDLLSSKEGTDVTFKVGSEVFVAHRCILVAQSAIFKAELFGPMKEGKMASVIQIEDMEPKVFRSLLSFIYTDSLPKMEIDMVEEEGKAQEALWLQHLLAAADRYDLRRLKALC
ncbi:hypothetical protein CFC21_048969 [Triticum aestivum]|uniref:Speckle-type POZ protein-like protein n=4 Tax=Triticinae TaxID=1648030 RepID=A0A453G1R8_AEGTS|nr:BTB/POZ and MATH domain-containing protein 3-like [Triticum aestivum]KAF7038864.1 hypothetical protein CFC21_048969 [Triticum aestivum]